MILKRARPGRRKNRAVTLRLTEDGRKLLKILGEYAGSQADAVESLLRDEFERLQKTDPKGLSEAMDLVKK